MDSDSDWDSLPGDPEPQSLHESSQSIPQPSVVPAPPKTKSPRGGAPQTNNLAVRKATKTPSKASANISDTGSSPRPKRMYGKGASGLGVTMFVDQGDRSDKSEKRQLSQSPRMDGNVNRGGRSGKGLELRDMNSNAIKDRKDSGQANEGFNASEEPPFTNFRDALPAIDVKDMSSNQQERKQNKPVKEAYLQAKTPDTDNGPSSLSSPRLPAIQDSDESEMSNGKMNQFGVKDDQLVDGQGQIILDIRNDVSCCAPCSRKPTGHTYMFSHGNSQYFSVVPEWREPYTKAAGERSERWLTYFWQEIFGVIALLVDFGLIFLFELMKFTFRRVLMRLLVGFIVVFGDHFLKPTLATMFNSLLQPLFIFMRNVLLGLKNGLRPLLDISREIIQQTVMVLKAFRLFELNWKPTFTNTDNRSTYSQYGHQPQIKEV